MPSLDDIIHDMHTAFRKLYEQSGAPAGGAVVAYEPIGRTVTSAMFRLQPADAQYSQPLALEQFSKLTNVLPTIENGVFGNDARNLDNMYGNLLLAPSLPSPGAAGETFARVKAEAVRALDPTMGSLIGPYPFRPAYASPPDWFDASAQANWHHYDSTTSSTTGANQDGAAPDTAPPQSWSWTVLQAVGTAAAAPPVQRHTGGVNPGSLLGLFGGGGEAAGSQPRAGFAARAGAFLQAAAQSAPVAALSPAASRQIQTFMPLVSPASPPQPVTTANLSLAFDYMLVTIRRPWLDDAFLESLQWYLPGRPAGCFSAGLDSNNTGMFAYIPVAFVVVKSLRVAGGWSEQDKAVLSNGNVSLGPFALVTGSSDHALISEDGVQIVAWVCRRSPVLPPDSDPALPVTADTQ